MYPKNPPNGYIDEYADGFDGCVGCDSSDHRFSVEIRVNFGMVEMIASPLTRLHVQV